MNKYFFCFISFISILTITESCGTTSKLYRHGENDKIYTGQLSDSTFTALKQFLIKSANSNLKDTIIIKYDFNNETCWNILDQSEDAHIMGFVTRHKQRVQHVLATRNNVSIFDFREPGNNLNKIKKWNNSILIDSSKQLFNLLFKERSTCGSSIIVMPDKKYIFIRSDSHSEILELTQNKIIEAFSKK